MIEVHGHKPGLPKTFAAHLTEGRHLHDEKKSYCMEHRLQRVTGVRIRANAYPINEHLPRQTAAAAMYIYAMAHILFLKVYHTCNIQFAGYPGNVYDLDPIAGLCW